MIYETETEVNKEIPMEPLRNLEETIRSEDLIFFRNYQYWLKFFVSFKK